MRFGPSRVCRVQVGEAFVQASAAFNWPQHGDRQWQAISQLPNIGGNGFVWILVAMATTYFVAHTGPLSGSRPASTDRSLSEHIGEQRIDARLWQDPFAVVADDLAKSELKPEICNRQDGHREDIETYCQPPWERLSGKPDSILVVSVSGAPYADDQEGRRRRRYAVLAGLDAEGFVPEDAQHIGFYWPNQPRPSQQGLTPAVDRAVLRYESPPRYPQPPREALRSFPTNGSNRGPSVPMSKRNTGESCSSGSMRTFSLHRRSNRCRQTRSRQK